MLCMLQYQSNFISWQELEANNIPLENVHIVYSPFARTKHTAKVVATALNLPFEGPQCKVSPSNTTQRNPFIVWINFAQAYVA